MNLERLHKKKKKEKNLSKWLIPNPLCIMNRINLINNPSKYLNSLFLFPPQFLRVARNNSEKNFIYFLLYSRMRNQKLNLHFENKLFPKIKKTPLTEKYI